MSKTIGSILEIGVGAALEFTPFAPVGTSLILAGAAGIVSSLLATAPKPDQTETALKQPISPRTSGYGPARSTLCWTVA